MKSNTRKAAATWAAILTLPALAEPPSFSGLGFLDDATISTASGMSGDGRVVVGWSGNVAEVFVWTPSSGMQRWPTPPLITSPIELRPLVVSGDGSTLPAISRYAPGCQELVLANAAGAVHTGISTCFLPVENPVASVAGLSHDAMVIVGNYNPQAGWISAFGWYWSAKTGERSLGLSTPRDISMDGRVVVGAAYDERVEAFRAARWVLPNEPNEPIEPEFLTPSHGSAMATSPDGNTVVGHLGHRPSHPPHVPFVWRAGSGVSVLELPAGFSEGEAINVSADDTTIVVVARASYTSETLIWRAGSFWKLRDYLTEHGVVIPDGWRLDPGFRLISSDGRTFVGTGVNPNGLREAWRATLGDPCPTDWNQDGRVDSQDFFAFVAAFFAGQGDFNGDGVTDSNDLFEFVTAFVGGCG